MGFGGGGGGALPNHEHTNIALDGGPLDFVNTTIGSLTANSMTYSDGAALQELKLDYKHFKPISQSNKNFCGYCGR